LNSSATTNVYSMVANVHAMNLSPIGMGTLIRLTIAALVPAIPLAFVTVPFNVIMEHIFRLLL
jgi:hypothetical protein